MYGVKYLLLFFESSGNETQKACNETEDEGKSEIRDQVRGCGQNIPLLGGSSHLVPCGQ